MRVGDGTGWVLEAELINAQEVEAILRNPAPRFVTAPTPVPDPRARGEIVIEAKVNTDGDVVTVAVVKNTTGLQSLADANGAALKQARFYPMVQKGQRMSFTYGYGVTY